MQHCSSSADESGELNRKHDIHHFVYLYIFTFNYCNLCYNLCYNQIEQINLESRGRPGPSGGIRAPPAITPL